MRRAEVSKAEPMAVPRCGVSRLIAAMTASLSSVGACTRKALSLNETTPILTPCRLLFDEGARRRLGRLQAVGLQVVGAHAAGNIHREDHGAFVLTAA